MIRVFLILFLMLSNIADAEIYCDANILQWRQLCLEAMPEEECIVEDVCILFDETDTRDILSDARIEIPEDTPEGFQEQIYVVP